MLVWLDLEMTGLDPDNDVIVEIASLVTDDELNILAEGPDLVVAAPVEKLDGMNEIVRRMHDRSGLRVAIGASAITVEEAEEATLAFIRQHVDKPKTAPLCGNSIGMDRRFLARYMPELEDYLHYRSVDVSSVKELCRRWNPAVYSAAPKQQSGHRALGDIRESVAELAYYREQFFRLAPPELSAGSGSGARSSAGSGAGAEAAGPAEPEVAPGTPPAAS
jgi:oligoribonuclease